MLAAQGPRDSDPPLSISCLPEPDDAEWGRSLGSSRHALGWVSAGKVSRPGCFLPLGSVVFSPPSRD